MIGVVMRYKNTLLIAFFLSLFVLQQTQASAKLLQNKGNISASNSVQTSGIPAQLYVTVAHLDEFNYPKYENNNIVKCESGDPFWSCGEGGSGYPYGDENPVLISMEDYILDVIPREMNVAENTYTLASLQAQAVVARSYADYRLRLYGAMDNSVNFQVFIPNAYELYNPAATELIGNAVSSTSGQYLSYGGEAIDAQFASDSILRTAACLNADYTQCHPYLIRVSDPVSDWQLSEPACDAINNGNSELDDPSTEWDDYGKVWGMSQKGAIRWSLGNHCANATAGNLPWPVTWTDYRQILVHYYTGVDILNGSGGKVAPDDRWNLLWHEVPVGATAPPNTNMNFEVRIQNTSIFDWGNNEIKVWYKWDNGNWTDTGTYVPAASKGEDKTFRVENIISPSNSANTLHLDLRRGNGTLFSEQSPACPMRRLR
jgi:hypothetical protein